VSTARRHDIRLVLPAAATWMAAAVVAAWPVGRGVTTVAVTGGLLAAAAVARRFALVAVATGLLLGAAAATTHVWLVHSGPVARLASRHGHAELTMRLVRDPLTRASVLMALGRSPSTLREASPLTHAGPGAPPFLLGNGGRNSGEFAARLRAAGVPVTEGPVSERAVADFFAAAVG